MPTDRPDASRPVGAPTRPGQARGPLPGPAVELLMMHRLKSVSTDFFLLFSRVYLETRTHMMISKYGSVK